MSHLDLGVSKEDALSSTLHGMTFSGTPSIDSPVQEKPAEEPPVLVSPPIAPLAVDFWRGRLKGLWIRACQEAVADLRAKRWVRFLVVCWTACLVIGLVMTPLAFASPGYKSPSNYDSMACRPDGSFRPFSFEYDPWGISGFFQITMGYGSLTFTQAKVIDVIWDIVSIWQNQYLSVLHHCSLSGR